MPYIYSLTGKIYQDNYTIMRGLPMDFAADESVKNISDQYMFGPSILVNPVYEYQKRSRLVYLPNTNGWYDFYSGKFFDGGQTMSADAPYEKMPLYIREGSIISGRMTQNCCARSGRDNSFYLLRLIGIGRHS